MKRMMTLLLALTMLFALAACGTATQTDADADETALPETTDADVTDTPANETLPEAVESDLPQMSDISVKDVLDRVHDYHEATAGSSLQLYSAAATLLNFCKAGGPRQEGFADDVKQYIDALEDRDAFREQYDAVAALADQISKGDVTLDDANAALVDTDVTLEDFDPLAFEHEQLDVFNDAVNAAFAG